MQTTLHACGLLEKSFSPGEQAVRLFDADHGLRPPLLPRRSGYEIRPARTAHQHGMASMLVRQVYARRGYHCESVEPQAEEPNRLTLAAWHDDEILATLTLGRDSPAGLLADALYARELDRLRRPDRTLCEVIRLAVAPNSSSSDLLITLIQACPQHAAQVFGASDLVTEVNPRHAPYYQRLWGFRQIGELRQCPRVNAPAVLLHRQVEDFGLATTHRSWNT
ncbi:N-acyl amino acid synthase FeeM domain-containing protein [Accumulibacter sp.]|uniref:N-acyl amino acid synthase FeeM domain-containing protein n=1 Tax=Accumulibacter sp. TaxID=2053492 RepID=UPI0028C4DF2D|nr:hypothetical protein [Accumulibacter sp.]